MSFRTPEQIRVIAQAQHLLMHTRGMSERESYACLRSLAMRRRQRLADLAQSLLNQATHEYGTTIAMSIPD